MTTGAPTDRPPLRVLLVDDEALVRDGLQLILERAGGFTVVGQAADGEEAVRVAAIARPDIALVDVRMPGVDGIRATAGLVALPDPPQVVVLTTFGLDDHVFDALEAGAVGFLLKETPPRQLEEALHTVAAGGSVLSPSVTRAVVRRLADGDHERRRDAADRVAELTDRERDVLVLLAEGGSNADIAAHINLSTATVKTHVSHLLLKLGTTNRVQAAMLAHRAGLLDSDPPPTDEVDGH